MLFFIFFIFCIIVLLLINKLFNYKKILLHKSGNHKHKDMFKINIPLSGGLYFFICFIFLLIITNYNYLYIFIVIFSFPMLVIGLIADINYNLKPILRLFYSFLVILLFIFFFNLSIDKVDINLLDYYLKNQFLSVLFTSFCILILINGYNFIDGTHGNLALYNMGVYFFIFFNTPFQYSNLGLLDQYLYSFGIIIIFFVFVILNFLKKNFMGDNGSYFLGTLTGAFIILFYKKNNINSIYIINILIYPAFEVLWSMIRKYLQNKKLENPDKLHLHHLILNKLSLKLKKDISSIITSITIFLVNFIFMLFASLETHNRSYQIKILILYVTFYIICYFALLKKKNN